MNNEYMEINYYDDNNDNNDKYINEILLKLNDFISNLDELSENYNIIKSEIDDIYEILQGDIMAIFIQSNGENCAILSDLIKYHYEIYNEIKKSISYEDICQIIKKYIMNPNELGYASLKYDLGQNLMKINMNQIKKVIYKTAPRLLIKPQEVLIDMMFEEQVSSNYLIKTIEWLKKK